MQAYQTESPMSISSSSPVISRAIDAINGSGKEMTTDEIMGVIKASIRRWKLEEGFALTNAETNWIVKTVWMNVR